MSEHSYDLAAMYDIAVKLRTEFEAGAYNMGGLLDLMQAHYDDDTTALRARLRASLATFPFNCCDLASVLLRNRFGFGAVVEGFYLVQPDNNKKHAFLGVGGFVCDITADQFGGPPVYVGASELPWCHRLG